MTVEFADSKRFTKVYFDGEPVQELHRRLFRLHFRILSRAKSKEELLKALRQIEIKVSRGLVYKWLAERGYLKAELKTKLKRYKLSEEAIEEVIKECQKLGYLDDEREGKLFIRGQMRKGYGPQMIAYKLTQKAPELKEMAESAMTEEEQQEAIKKWIGKKLRGDDLSDLKVKQRLYRFLKSKGFDDEPIRRHLFLD
ncbi:MAG: regulatory protein RecX [Chlamydiia bacterium]|nr:regulatory protein RecX [Chlamydiia bacterium]